MSAAIATRFGATTGTAGCLLTGNSLTDGDLKKGVVSLMPIEGFGARCVLDGLEIDCSRIRGNASAQCPNNDCGATLTFNGRRNGHVVDRWLPPAPQGWDPSYDGTYKPGWTKDEKTRVWKRQDPAPPSRQNNAGPQNPPQNPMDTTPTENLLTEDCVHFLNSILAELKDPYSYNFRSILRKAKAQGPLYTRNMTAEEKKKALAGTHSRVGAPGFYIYIDAGSYAKDPFLLIHELFHAAAGSGTSYSHTEMAKAAYNAALADPVFRRHMERHPGFIPKQVDYTRPPNDIKADGIMRMFLTRLLRSGAEQNQLTTHRSPVQT